MQNHLLGQNAKITPYYKELNNYTGSVTATILMTQIEYWFSKTNGEQFFKFLEPCDRKDYKEGDSWVEELGFTKYEFRTAFAKIGKVYKSKNEYLKSKDKFEDKPYLSYYDRLQRRIYYVRNHEKVDEIIDEWISRKSQKPTSRSGESQLVDVDKVHLEKLTKPTSNSSRVLQESTSGERERKDLTPPKDLPSKPTKDKYGDFVKLTDQQHKKLCDDFGQAVIAEYIEKVNNYVGSSGRRYKSHYHTIRNWLSRDNIKTRAEPDAKNNAQDRLDAEMEEAKKILGLE